jgi:DNA-binding transcriptional LysR family regulator
MNPNLLKQLAIVVKQGSLSSAAELLYITQPTLSRAIQQLEMRVGARVLKRTRYGMVPTEIGVRLAQIGERILAESEHSEEVIRQWQSGYHNEFAIGIDPLWEFATVAEMTGYFMREKRYVFHFRTGSAAQQIALLQDGQLDFVLAPAHLTVAQTSLEREILFHDRSGIFAGKKSQLVGLKQPVPLDELIDKNWIIAGASAGFLDGEGELAGPNAASMVFTGSIRSVIHLLNTTDILVRLPARLALMTGEIVPEQMITVQGQSGTRRDIALWSRTENSERPEMLKIRELISDWVSQLNREIPKFGLEL